MKIKIIGTLVAATALLAGCETEQAAPTCLTAHGDYVVKYVPVDPANTCADLPGGEFLGVSRYSPNGEQPASMALRTQEGGLRGYWTYADAAATEIADEAPDAQAEEEWFAAWAGSVGSDQDLGAQTIGLGQFPASDSPDADGFCSVSNFSFKASAGPLEGAAIDASSFELVELVEDDPDTAEDETEMGWVLSDSATFEELSGPQETTYEFSNFKVYVSARSPGVTFKSDLKFTSTATGTDGGSCTAEYTAIGLYPISGLLTDNSCAETADCDPCGYDADGAYTLGTGIIPDIAVECDPNVYGGWCVLAGTELPAFRSDAEIQANAEECDRRATLATGG